MKKKYQDPKVNTISLFDFNQMYNSEEAGEQALFRLKWPNGFRCAKCGCKHCCTVRHRRLPVHQCSNCHVQTSSISGTVMACTKLSLLKWFMALYFVATNKDGISEMALAKYIDVTLKTAWSVLH